MLRRAVVFLAVLAGLTALYEGYKWLWETAGFGWPFEVNDRTMPHTWDIVGQLFRALAAEQAAADRGAVGRGALHG